MTFSAVAWASYANDENLRQSTDQRYEELSRTHLLLLFGGRKHLGSLVARRLDSLDALADRLIRRRDTLSNRLLRLSGRRNRRTAHLALLVRHLRAGSRLDEHPRSGRLDAFEVAPSGSYSADALSATGRRVRDGRLLLDLRSAGRGVGGQGLGDCLSRLLRRVFETRSRLARFAVADVASRDGLLSVLESGLGRSAQVRSQRARKTHRDLLRLRRNG